MRLHKRWMQDYVETKIARLDGYTILVQERTTTVLYSLQEHSIYLYVRVVIVIDVIFI